MAQDLGEVHQENFLTFPVTAVAVDPDAVQAAAEQQEAQTHTVELSAAQKRNAKKAVARTDNINQKTVAVAARSIAACV